ncbi:pre-mRNA cleavage complex II Clp1-like, putative [Bodo saltans]|uniref:Pre-mRNA cleavage complex II Clp1-like, putative n=1 Tax=Bodo saltans TaxID=75058 RepID=A0A0S4IVZ6_BODSA|nr:pre-mRNA cleavage complex II Clp1-like, putative [Bodo saltans]|eukprot:CUF23711.1 pre-mRNA cleavage complex II Clp1-like, putative [Bodo saltans]
MASSSSRTERVELNTVEIFISFQVGSIVVLDGHASIFGAPLRPNVRYRFRERYLTVQAIGKVRLDINGDFSLRTPRALSTDLQELETRFDLKRQNAQAANKTGPVILLVGEKDTGKSTACRTLANLALRSQSAIVVPHSTAPGTKTERDDQQVSTTKGIAFVDLDVGQGGITCPGSMASTFLESTIPVDEDFQTMIPLVLFFGDKSVTQQTRKRYLDLCSWTAQSIASVQLAKPGFRSGGVIINTMGWVRELGYDLLKQIITMFDVTDIVVCGGNQTLFDGLSSDFSFARDRIEFHTFQLSSTPSETAKTGLDRIQLRHTQLTSYFSGTLRTPLVPVRLVVYLKDVELIDAVTLEDFNMKLLRPLTVAAVSTAPQRELCASANIAGFVIITDIGKKTLTLLSPAPGALPRPFLLVAPTFMAKPELIPPFGASS